jgi:hypothetical protein
MSTGKTSVPVAACPSAASVEFYVKCENYNCPCPLNYEVSSWSCVPTAAQERPYHAGNGNYQASSG